MKFAYLDEIRNLLDVVEREENETMEKAVDLLTAAIRRKSSIYVFGACHAGILAEEMFYRAGGLMVVNPIFGQELMLNISPITQTSSMERLEGYGRILGEKTPFCKGDILIAHSVSGRNPVTIELAMHARSCGATVIAITNLAYSKQVSSRLSSGKRLFEVAELVLDNHGQKGDACIAIEGMEQRVGPSSTVIGASIVNSIVVEVARKLAEDTDLVPPIFYSANMDGGDEKNCKIFEEYKDVIHYNL